MLSTLSQNPTTPPNWNWAKRERGRERERGSRVYRVSLRRGRRDEEKGKRSRR